MQQKTWRQLVRYVIRDMGGLACVAALATFVVAGLWREREVLPDPSTVAGHHAIVTMYERLQAEQARLAQAAAPTTAEPPAAVADTALARRLRALVPFHQHKPWFGLCEAHAAPTVQAFQHIVQQDPLLRQHYANFNWQNAELVDAPATKAFHVMYRQGGRLLWSKAKMTIRQGEPLITDGQRTVRSFCCNEISDGPLGPTLPDTEPRPEWLQRETFDSPALQPEEESQPLLIGQAAPQPATSQPATLPPATPQSATLPDAPTRQVTPQAASHSAAFADQRLPEAPQGGSPQSSMVARRDISTPSVPVPEASATLLLCMALVLLVGWARRKA